MVIYRYCILKGDVFGCGRKEVVVYVDGGE